MANIENLLKAPEPGISLDQLKLELNQLTIVGHKTKLAFCQRLAVVYLILVGRPPRSGQMQPDEVEKIKGFYEWCNKNIKSIKGSPYALSSIRVYYRIGFSNNPSKALEKVYTEGHNRKPHKLGIEIQKAIKKLPNRVPTINKIVQKEKVAGGIAIEINTLMTAWEQASVEARKAFIHMVTGIRI